MSEVLIYWRFFPVKMPTKKLQKKLQITIKEKDRLQSYRTSQLLQRKNRVSGERFRWQSKVFSKSSENCKGRIDKQKTTTRKFRDKYSDEIPAENIPPKCRKISMGNLRVKFSNDILARTITFPFSGSRLISVILSRWMYQMNILQFLLLDVSVSAVLDVSVSCNNVSVKSRVGAIESDNQMTVIAHKNKLLNRKIPIIATKY